MFTADAVDVPLIFLFPLGMIVLTLGLWRSRLVPLWTLAPAVLATVAEIAHAPSTEHVVAVLAPITSVIIAGSLIMLSRRGETARTSPAAAGVRPDPV